MNRLKVLLPLLLLFCVGVLALRVDADTFKPVELYPAGAVQEKALPNGVKTLVRATPGSNVASLQVWVEAGSRFETDANSGSTHLIEMLAMQGSRQYPTETDGELSGPQPTLENWGAQVNSYTSRDDVFWSVTLAPSHLDEAAKVMADAVLYPDLSDAGIAAAKTMAAGEWMSRRLDPVGYSSDLAYNEAFQKHPYRKTVQGELDQLKKLTAQQVQEYHKTRFTGSHLHVVVVGDVDAAATEQILADTFGKAPQTAKPDAPIPAEPLLTEKRQVTQRGSLPIEVITFAWRSPGISTPKDTVATDLILTYLNEGAGAALRRVLQNGQDEENEEGDDDDDDDDSPPTEPSGLAGGFSVDYLTQRDSGLFLISIIAPFKTEEAKAAVLELMAKVKNGLSDADLQHAKTLLHRQYVGQAETSVGQAGGLGFYDAIDSYKFAVDYLNLVEQSTNADITRVAQKYFGSDNYVQVTLLPALGNPQENEGGGIIAFLPGGENRTY